MHHHERRASLASSKGLRLAQYCQAAAHPVLIRALANWASGTDMRDGGQQIELLYPLVRVPFCSIQRMILKGARER
jgi:hypothetical protein